MERTETARLAIAHATSRVRTHARANGPVVLLLRMWDVGCCALRFRAHAGGGARRPRCARRV